MSKFVVSARKYRPQRFEDVVGQQHVAGTLKNALANNHLAHAFLFTGPRGVGKTTCARILAKILNCDNLGVNQEACNLCPSCTAFNEQASFNVFELDAASNNSVDHIRSLTEQVRYLPQQGKYKVFIIDEVHMLSPSAFNAFLKTLEEPPKHVVFILATTEKHKIIPTILSRCQIFDFRRITSGDMVLHLKSICEKENIEAEEEGLHIIAQKADGALRDALSIFDRITSTTGKKVSYQDVVENLNVLDFDYFFKITEAILVEDSSEILQTFDQILRKGFDPDLFILGLAEHLRNILVCKDEATLALLESGDNIKERYRKQALITPANFIISALNLANECDIHLKMARNKRLHVEIYLIKMTFIGRAIFAGNASGEEKKKPESAVQKLTPIPSPGNTKTVRSNATELSSEQMSAVSAELKIGTKIAMKLTAFDDAVEKETAENLSKKSLLSPSSISEQWQYYSENLDSALVKSAFDNASLVLKDKTVSIATSSVIDKNLIQSELMQVGEAMRSALHDPQIKFQLILEEIQDSDPSKTSVKRPLNSREKLDIMNQANPVLTLLIKQFELKVQD